MKNYIWKSSLSDYIQNYIQLKQQTGMKFQQQERYLQHFDTYYYQCGYDGYVLTKPMLEHFIYKKEERPVSHYNKEIVMRDFAVYLNDVAGNCYIPIVKTLLPRCTYVPHIYSSEELHRFFLAVDQYPETPHSYRNQMDPVLFRFLYGTGARVSEALNLTLKEVDLKNGIVVICGAKNNRDRLLPVSSSLAERLSSFVAEFHIFSSDDTPFFPGCMNGKMHRMDSSTAYSHFRDYLLMADIPHTASGPNVHCFRHGFAVACLKRWVMEGTDLTNMLPYLAAYMGHGDFRATGYYLRLTADLYPDIISRNEAEFGYVIPEGGFCYEES